MKFRTKYAGPHVDVLQIMVVPVAEWRHQRPVTKKEKCCQCGWCYLYCPTGCIENKGNYFAADLNYCKGCGICARECPKKAIMMVEEESAG